MSFSRKDNCKPIVLILKMKIFLSVLLRINYKNCFYSAKTEKKEIYFHKYLQNGVKAL